jgi:hypothetical protein
VSSEVEPFAIQLPAQGMGRIHFANRNVPFEFILGSSRHRAPSFVAELLSPKIAALHANDPTPDAYKVQTADPLNLFPRFISLGRGQKLDLDDANIEFFSWLAKELENQELLDLIPNHFSGDLKVNTVSQRLIARSVRDEDTDLELRFIVEHFLFVLFSQENFTVANHDQFFECIVHR